MTAAISADVAATDDLESLQAPDAEASGNESVTYNVSHRDWVFVEVVGGDGGNGSGTGGGLGGNGSQIAGYVDVEGIDKLTLYGGEHGDDGSNGGAAGANPVAPAEAGEDLSGDVGGGGGAFSGIEDGNGSYRLVAGGGGGGGAEDTGGSSDGGAGGNGSTVSAAQMTDLPMVGGEGGARGTGNGGGDGQAGDTYEGDRVLTRGLRNESLGARLYEDDPGPVFYVNVTGTNGTVYEGETLAVDVTVTNEGTASDEQTITLEDFDGTQVDSKTVQLNADESQNVTLEWGTHYNDSGTDNVTVRSDNDSDAQQATVDAAIDGMAGNGTESNPYVITDAVELQAMQDNLTASYVLGNDINATESETWNGGAGFDPVGEKDPYFNGTLEGDGHTVEGLYIDRGTEDFVGLVGATDGGTEIRNVTLENVDVTGNETVGGLAGLPAKGDTVSNVTVSGSVTGSRRAGGVFGRLGGTLVDATAINVSVTAGEDGAGGLVGLTHTESTIANSTATGTVTGHDRVGGLVGGGQSNLSDSSANVTVDGNTTKVGGAVGYNNQYGHISNVSVEGTVTGGTEVGGLVGQSRANVLNSTVDVTVNATGKRVGGLVGILYDDGYDPLVANSSASGTITGDNRVGGLVGRAYYGGRIRHSHANVSIDADRYRVGGLVGGTTAPATITESYATGDVNGTQEIGGLVGFHDGNIDDSWANVTVNGSSEEIGGLAGRLDTFQGEGTINRSYAVGNVTGAGTVGGIAGNNGGTITDSYWDNQTTGQESAVGNGTVQGTKLTTAEMTGDDAPPNMDGFAFGETWTTTDSYPALISDPVEFNGSGTESDPYVITTVRELQAMDDEPDAYYVLGSDIEANWTEDWNGGDGFAPVGADSTFTGTLDGNGYNVSGLYIDRDSTDWVGLFAETGDVAEVTSVTLSDINVTGAQSTGGLVGVSRATTIDNVSITGNVTGTKRTGGLAGWAEGTIRDVDVDVNVSETGSTTHIGAVVGHLNSGATIVRTEAAGRVDGYQESGGLVGWNDASTIKNSHANVTVNGTGSASIGGLAGITINGATIENSSAVGNVTSPSTEVGGLVGRMYGDQSNDSGTGDAIHDSWAAGYVSGTDRVGGLVGRNDDDNDNVIGNTYWDNESSNQSAGVGQGDAGNVTGLTTAQMTGSAAEGNMTALDFANTWAVTDGYPRHTWAITDSPYFAVSVNETNSPVVEGETLVVNATIENTGELEGTQTIALETNGTERDNATVTLASGANQTVSLEWMTGDGDGGDYTAAVSSANETNSTAVTVQEPPYFAVTLDETNSPVVEGENLTVNATIENTGDLDDTQTVSLDVNGTERDNATVTLAAGANQTVSLEWTTGDGDAGDYTAAVSSANETNSTSVTVQEPPYFAVSMNETNSPVTEGETLTVNATIENTGDLEDSQTITLETNGTQRDSVTLTLAARANQTVSLEWATADGDAGDYTAAVSSSNETNSTSVTVQEPANFTVAIDGTNSPVVEGENLTVNATVENTGDVQDTQTIALETNGTERDTATVTLASGANQTVSLGWATVDGDVGDYTAAVSSANETNSTSVTVQEPPYFAVALDETNSPVVEGETLVVNATVENTGDLDDTQTISLETNGTERDTATVTIASGANETVALEWVTSDGDVGDYTAAVSSTNETNSTAVTVQEPPYFAVSMDETNSPVTEGENLTVNATIANTGDLEDTQTITLEINGTQHDSITRTLPAGTNETVSLEWATGDGDAGDYTTTVASANETNSTSVRVQEPANFTVAIDGTNSPIVEGENLTVNATIENTGDVQDTQTITLETNGTRRSSTSVTLSGGANATISLEWATGIGDAANYTATVASANETNSTSVTVQERPSFAVTIDETNSPVVEGENLTVDATIANTGDLEDTQTISLETNATEHDSVELTLAAGTNETVTLEWATVDGDAGDYTATVASANETNSTSVTVQKPPYFDVTLEDSNDPIVEGENLTVNATIENTGDVSDSQTITLESNGSQRDSVQVTLTGGANQTISLEWATTTDDAGEYSATVASANETNSTSVTVQEPAFFAVAVDGTNSPVDEGETLTVDATVENTGDLEETQTITLETNGTRRDSREVTISAGETTAVTLEWATGTGDAGDYTATVSSADDADAVGVTVAEPTSGGSNDDPSASFAVDISADDPVPAGSTLNVTATIENFGAEAGTQDIEFLVDGTLEDVASNRTLEAGAEENVTFAYDTSRDEIGELEATVRSDNDSATQSVTVEDGTNVSLEIVAATDPVAVGETLEVTAELANAGDATAVRDVEFRVDDELVAIESNLSIDPGAARNATFSHAVGGDDPGELEVRVRSGNETDNRTVTVNEPADGSTVYVGSDDGTLYAVDASTGDRHWSVETGAALQASPIVVDGTVYVGSDGGTLYAVDAETGATEWTSDAPGAAIRSSPTVVDGTVFVGSDDGTLYAVDAETGGTKWRFTRAGGAIRSSPTVADGTVFVGSDDGTLYAVDAETGERTWAFSNASGAIRSSPTVVDGTVYVGSDDERVYAVDAETGAGVWTATDPNESVRSAPTVSEGTVFVGTANNTLYAFDAATGARTWADADWSVASSPTVADGTVFAGSDADEGRLGALDAETGAENWVFGGLEAPVRSSPTVFDGTVFVGSDDGTLHAVDATTGDREWRFDAGSRVRSSPTVVASPSTGHSVDSRVRLETLGHHEHGDRVAFDVAIDDAPATATVDAEFEVDATVRNDGFEAAAANVSLEVDGTTVDEVTVESLAGGSTDSVTLAYEPTADDVGERTVTVRVDDSTASRTITVEERETESDESGGDDDSDGGPFDGSGGDLGGSDGDDETGDDENEDSDAGTPGNGTNTSGTDPDDGSRTADLETETDEDDGGTTVFGFDGSEVYDSTVDYEPSSQTQHVGSYLWLTVLGWLLACWILLTRRTREAKLLAATLFTASLRTASDVLHVVIDNLGPVAAPLAAINLTLEVAIAVLFVRFAARYADTDRFLERPPSVALAGLATAAVTAIATNPIHGLVFTAGAAEGPFTYVATAWGPVGVAILALNAMLLLSGAGMLVRSLTVAEHPAWRPAAVVATGTCLAIAIAAASALEAGPLPEYDYSAAGVAGFVVATTFALLGHGLHQVRSSAQQSLLDEMDDAIVILDDAGRVVETNATARQLLPTLEQSEPLEAALSDGFDLPEPGDTVDASLADLLGATPASEREGCDAAPSVRSAEGAAARNGDGANTGEGADANGATTATGGPLEGDDEGDEANDVDDGTSGERASTEEDAESGEYAVADGDGTGAPVPERRHFLVRTTAVTAAEEDIGYTVRFADVTVIKRRTEELREQNDQLDQFASTVSHDLRNPLNVAEGYVDLLADRMEAAQRGDPLDETTLESYLGQVDGALERMEAIIEDILAMARSADPVTDADPLEYGRVARDAWSQVDAPDATLEVTASGTIDADRDRLQRLLENLFRNAVDHAGPAVTVETGLEDDGFYVVDDGPGIPADERDVVFDQGYTTAREGTGMGLAIVDQLAAAHGWTVEVADGDDELETALEGACFRVTGCETVRDFVPVEIADD